MTIKKATEILLNQKKKLTTENLRQDTWLTQTSSFIKDFFGDTSNEYIFIKDFKFYSKTFDSMSAEYDTNAHINRNSREASQFIGNCIDTLNHKGLYKAPKQNFLTRLSETALWTTLSVGVTGLISIGLFFGNMSSDKQNIELRQENKLLKGSLSIFRTSTIPTNQEANSRADTIHNKPPANK